MNSLEGWLRLYRKSIKSSIFENPFYWKVWCWCLLKASYKNINFPLNGMDMKLYEGQFITGIKKACLELNTTPQKYRTAMGYLKSTYRVTIKTTTRFSVITVLKWREHQYDNTQSNKQITNKQQTNNKPITTYKNIKNIKNIKEEEPSKKTLIKQYVDKYSNLDLEEEWDKFEDYNRDIRKTPVRSASMAWRNWLKKAEEFRQTSPEAIREREIEAEKKKNEERNQIKGKPLPRY